MTFFSLPRFGIFVLLLLLLVGCGPANPQGRVSLKGSVSVNGTPVKEGTISFSPLGNPVEITQSGAVIRDGKYTVPTTKGVIPGEYAVQIYASEKTGEIDKNRLLAGMSVEVTRQLIPPKYNEKTELKITIERGKSYDFDLVVEKKDFKKR